MYIFCNLAKYQTKMAIFRAFRKYKYGIVLSGGGARGMAHIGVLKALNEEGIFPQVISGVSAGAIAGALYADGYKPDELQLLFRDSNFFKFVNLTYPKNGLLTINGLQSFLEQHLRSRTFEALKIPLFIAVTNYNTGLVEYHHQGQLIPRILASSSIPVVFNPVVIDRQIYMDGGLVDNLPVSPVRSDCMRLIGSHVNPVGFTDTTGGLVRIAERAFHIGAADTVKQHARLTDIFIEPKELSKFSIFDVSHIDEIVRIGYDETINVLENRGLFNKF